jgi:hypothetical protein
MDTDDFYEQVIELLGNPIIAAFTLFLLLLVSSVLVTNVWEHIVVIVLTYFIADIINSFFVEIGEDYGKIFPKLNTEFDDYGHVFITYFIAVLISTAFSSSLMNIIQSHTNPEEVRLEIKSIANALIIVIMWVDTFIRR